MTSKDNATSDAKANKPSLPDEDDVEVQRPPIPANDLEALRQKRNELRIKDDMARFGAVRVKVSSASPIEYADGYIPANQKAPIFETPIDPGKMFGSLSESKHVGSLFVGEGTLNESAKVAKNLYSFLEALGYKIDADDGFKQGSWKKRFGFDFLNKNSKEKIENKVKIAEDVFYGRISSDTDEKLLMAISNLIKSLDNVDNVVIDAGPFLLFKMRKHDDDSSVFVKRLTLEERSLINKNPELLDKPEVLLMRLKSLLGGERVLAQGRNVGFETMTDTH